MTDLRAAAQQALEALEDSLSDDLTPYQAAKISAALRAALAEHHCDTHCTWADHAPGCVRAEPVEPVAWGVFGANLHDMFFTEEEAHEMARLKGDGSTVAPLYTAPPQHPAEPLQEPYTGDVTRIIREAGMTFHLGLPHKPVIEQMSRVVDLVYAEASIKAAQQFAAPPQRPAEPVQEPMATVTSETGADISMSWWHEPALPVGTKLYTSPPQRKPLTDEEISSLWDSHIVPVFGKNGINPIVFARAIEQAHGIGSKT
jgi:hypothetical protein